MGKDIIKEFEERFEDFYALDDPTEDNMDAGSEKLHFEELKTFILQAISQARQELLSEIEGKLPKEKVGLFFNREFYPEEAVGNNQSYGFNSCLKLIRSIINKYMFKETEEGQTHFCEACEWGQGKTTINHTCGKTPLQPSKEECLVPCEKHIYDTSEFNPHCHCCGLLMRNDEPSKENIFDKIAKHLQPRKEAIEEIAEPLTDEQWDKLKKKHKCDENCLHTEKHTYTYFSNPSKEECKHQWEEGCPWCFHCGESIVTRTEPKEEPESKTLEYTTKDSIDYWEKRKQDFIRRINPFMCCDHGDAIWKEVKKEIENIRQLEPECTCNEGGECEACCIGCGNYKDQCECKPESKDWENEFYKIFKFKPAKEFGNLIRSEKKKSEFIGYEKGLTKLGLNMTKWENNLQESLDKRNKDLLRWIDEMRGEMSDKALIDELVEFIKK